MITYNENSIAPRRARTLGSSSRGNSYGGSQRNEDMSEDYYRSLFMGTPYESQYLSIVNKYSNGAPSSLFGSLTGKNQMNAYNHQMKMYDELSALASKMYDEDYQSPVSESQRLRAAGLNPDLLGLTGAAAPQSTSQGVPSGIQNDNPLQITQSVLNFALSTYQSIQGFKSASLGLESQSIDNINKMMQHARPVITRNIADMLAKGSKGADDWSTIMKMYNPFKKGSREYKRYIKAFNNELSSSRYTAARGALDQLSSVEDGRYKYGSFVGSKNWSPDDMALYHFVGGMMDMEIALKQSQFKSNKSRSDYDYDYYSNIDGKQMAGYDQSIKESDSAEKHINRYRRKVYDQLYFDYKNGSMLAGLMIIGMNNAFNAGSQFITGAAQWLDNNLYNFK